jgi:hypothetical protein
MVISGEGTPSEEVSVSLFPIELALENLKGTFSRNSRDFMSKQEAYEWLKELSGEDFTMEDIHRWTKWVEKEMERHPPKFGEA